MKFFGNGAPGQAAAKRVPRLTYLADVPVAATTAGSLLLYRLLRQFPPEQLLILEGLHVSDLQTRLPGVRYSRFFVGWDRLLRTRLHRFYSPIILAGAARRAKRLQAPAKQHRTQAILTVAHQYSWLTAAALARSMNVPLHVILHDDPWFTAWCPQACRSWFESLLGTAARQAKSLLCVSPNMVDFIGSEYGVHGELLYPSWDVEAASLPVKEQCAAAGSFTIAYAGNMFFPGHRRLISSLAKACAKLEYKLLLYANIAPAQKQELELPPEAVRVHPLVPATELPKRLQEEADALFVPMSFEHDDRRTTMLSFPSKLTDYTSMGLPVLIWGPEYCSAVRWANENAEAAEVLTRIDDAELTRILVRLAKDHDYRYRLAVNAREKGRQHFSYERVVGKFNSILAGPGKMGVVEQFA